MQDPQERLVAEPFVESGWTGDVAWRSSVVRCDESDVRGCATILCCSLVLALCTSAFAMFGYDWGREVLEEIAGRSVSFGIEFAVAAALNLTVLLPSAFGFFHGLLSRRSTLTPSSFAPMLAGVLSYLAVYGAPVWLVPFALIGLSGLKIGAGFGALVSTEMRGRVSMKTMYPALIYLVPAGLLSFIHLDGNFGFREEVALFLGLTFLSSFGAAIACRAKSIPAGLSAAFLSSIPLVVSSMVGLLSLIAIAFIDPVHVVESLIATLIVLVGTSSSSTFGGVCGYLYMRKKDRSSLNLLTAKQ